MQESRIKCGIPGGIKFSSQVGKVGSHHLGRDPAIPTWDPGWDYRDPAYIPPDILPGCNLSVGGDTQLGLLPQFDHDLLKARNAETLFCTWAYKKYPNLKNMAPMMVSFTILMVKQVALCKLQCP